MRRRRVARTGSSQDLYEQVEANEAAEAAAGSSAPAGIAKELSELEMIELLRFIDITGDDDISKDELHSAAVRADGELYYLAVSGAGRALQRLDKLMLEVVASHASRDDAIDWPREPIRALR